MGLTSSLRQIVSHSLPVSNLLPNNPCLNNMILYCQDFKNSVHIILVLSFGETESFQSAPNCRKLPTYHSQVTIPQREKKIMTHSSCSCYIVLRYNLCSNSSYNPIKSNYSRVVHCQTPIFSHYFFSFIISNKWQNFLWRATCSTRARRRN